MSLFKRKPKCEHDWKILHGVHMNESDGDTYWERFHSVTYLRGFCRSCGKTSSWKISDWKMSDEEIKTYIKEVYDQ